MDNWPNFSIKQTNFVSHHKNLLDVTFLMRLKIYNFVEKYQNYFSNYPPTVPSYLEF